MNRAAIVLVAAFCLGWGGAARAAPPNSVDYTVDIGIPGDGRLKVTMECRGVRGTSFEVALPAWSPGWYVLDEADGRVGEVQARSGDGATLQVVATARRRWRVDPAGADTASLSYTVRATDAAHGFFDPSETADHAFVPGPTTLLHAVGATAIPSRVRYVVPPGWNVVSGNDPAEPAPYTFSARSYDALADHPAELGRMHRWDATVAGVPVSVIAVGRSASAAGPFARKCFALVEAATRVFGPPPFPRYVFHLRYSNLPTFLGGLEHANSCVIRMAERSASRTDFSDLRLAAHELAHAWIVKRIRPANLGPFDYSAPVRTPDLWFLEGVTDYFSPRLVVAAALAGEDEWRGYVARQVSEFLSNPARETVTLETASLKVWEGGRSDGYGGLSYYNKGFLVGWWLDTELRSRTEGRIGLDAMIPELMALCRERGYTPGALESTASRLAGKDLGADFKTWLRTTDPVDFDAIAAAGGLELVLQGGALDPGIVWEEAAPAPDMRRIAAVRPGGAAERAGLRPGDTVPDIRSTSDRFAALRPGQRFEMDFLRGGENRRATLTITDRTPVEARLRRRAAIPPSARRLLDQWSGLSDRAAP